MPLLCHALFCTGHSAIRGGATSSDRTGVTLARPNLSGS
jgi:hypothetical protein